MKAVFSKVALKALQKVDAKQRERILNALYAVPQGDIKPLEGKPTGRYRLRVGGYRVIFQSMDGVLYVSAVGARGDIYK